MREFVRSDPDTRVVVDDTTIYEIDLTCYRCLSEREQGEYFDAEERRNLEKN